MDRCSYASPIGELILAAEDGFVKGVWFTDQKHFPDDLGNESDDAETLEALKGWLDRYFKGEKPSPQELRLAPEGSEFSKRVWGLLLEIPYGSTVTYGELAKRLEAESGRKAFARAVGGAVGRNPVSIVIPCHRVIGSGGALTGYAAGVERKEWLLRAEGAFGRENSEKNFK